MMKRNFKNLFYCLCSFCLIWTSCDPDEPIDPPHEEEVITLLQYSLSPIGGGEAIDFIFEDSDGEGGNAPIVSTGILKANTNYTGAITLEGQHEDHSDDITAEIKDEDEEHQFFFMSDILTVDYSDKDENENPVGLTTNVMTKNAGNGTLTVILRHEPDKDATDVKNGDITNAGGETDIEVSFDITVE